MTVAKHKLGLMALSALIAAGAAVAQVASPVTPAAQAQPTAVVPEKVICKSEIETGSLIKHRKQCFTAKQWRYVNDQHEAEARHIVQDGTGKPNSD